MRGLHGDFSTMPLKDVVAYLGNKRASGTLRIDRQDVRKQAILHEGQVINASSTQPREYLGQFLVNMGHLTEAQFDKAYQTQQETRIYIGKILVMIGLVEEAVVTSALSMKTRETLLESFGWEDGGFSFDPNPPEPRLQGLDVRVDLLDLHREAEFRETAWQAIKAAFPRGSLRLKVEEQQLPELPRPGSLDARLVAMIQEGRTIDEMVMALNTTDFFLYQRLYALYRLEAVRVLEERPPSQPRIATIDVDLVESSPSELDRAFSLLEPASAEELMERARRLLLEGDAREAESLARKAFDLACSPESVELLREAEAALTGQLKAELMGARRVPSLLVAPASLKTMELSAPEKYLLSRIDGARDLSSIVQVSPLQELEALKLFQRFVETGLVRLS